MIADVSNQIGDPVFDDALNTASRVDLEQTPYLNVLASDKVSGALRTLNLPGEAKVTPAIARQVCSHEQQNDDYQFHRGCGRSLSDRAECDRLPKGKYHCASSGSHCPPERDRALAGSLCSGIARKAGRAGRYFGQVQQAAGAGDESVAGGRTAWPMLLSGPPMAHWRSSIWRPQMKRRPLNVESGWWLCRWGAFSASDEHRG